MARTVFLILLAVNLVMLLWIYLNAERREFAGREPQRVAMQLQPEKIRIVDPTVKVETVCRAFTGATLTDAQELAKTWSAQFPAAAFNVVAAPSASTFEAVITGFNTRAAATSRLNELRALGIAEGFAIRADDGGKFALAAAFSDRFGAEAKQRAATQKGVTGVSVVEHAAATNATILARGVVSALASISAQAATKNLSAANCP